MLNKNFSKKLALVIAVTLLPSSIGFAEESAGEKAKNATKEVWKDTKQEYREGKAEIICKTNDKECLRAKAKAKAKNAKDEIQQEADELKDKVD